MKTNTLLLALLLALLLPIFTPGHTCAGWLIYHKPAFEGQILDTETKEPIEGAVVVAYYYKRSMGIGAGTVSSIIDIREAMTDENGRFHIPSYTTLIMPFSWEDPAKFIIFKPGYIAVDGLYDRGLESLFSGRMVDMQTQEFEWLYNNSLVFRYRSPDIVELPRPTTLEEQKNSLPGLRGTDLPSRKMNNLISLYNHESSRLGLGRVEFKNDQ
jgi:hypothetical protein